MEWMEIAKAGIALIAAYYVIPFALVAIAAIAIFGFATLCNIWNWLTNKF